MITILDCYTDEPAGLGVPPYLGTYPRYLTGYFEKANYITIDDLRFYEHYNLDDKKKEINRKTNIRIYNLTKNIGKIKEILDDTTKLIVILGVHTPGKYLSALPGTLKEIISLIEKLDCEKILTGPAVFGTQLEGGKFFEKGDLGSFDRVDAFDFKYDEIKDYSIKGASIIKQISSLRVIEIETGRGCGREKGCSFCTEPLKHRIEFREKKDILNEIGAFYELGCRYFRLGKQSDFYVYPDVVSMLREIRKKFSGIKVLHIDNVNPLSVLSKNGEEITKGIVKYCTEGNIAAFGVESFDKKVFEKNNLNCEPEGAYEAIKILNKYGAERGGNGMPKFLPGINLLFGLNGESKETHNENMRWLGKILDDGLMLRRINIRQVSIFEGTPLFDSVGNKFIRKNKKYYWKWRHEIRQKIDFPLLERLVPVDTVLKDVRAEIYDGNTTFGRQMGTYPLVVGVVNRLELGKFYDVKVTAHMLRSVTAVVDNK